MVRNSTLDVTIQFIIYKNQNLTLNDKYKKCLFATGSSLEHLMPRAEADCLAYIKPGVNIKEEVERYNSGCGCDLDGCTGYAIKTVGGVPTCEASDDCKKGIQSVVDMWIDEEAITKHYCLVAFKEFKLLNYLCSHH